MTMFDDQRRAEEAQFARAEEMTFRITARRNRLLGLWAAERMGLSGPPADAYAKEVVDAEFSGGDRHVIAKIVADLGAKGHTVTEAQVKFELDHLAEQAKQQVMQE